MTPQEEQALIQHTNMLYELAPQADLLSGGTERTALSQLEFHQFLVIELGCSNIQCRLYELNIDGWVLGGLPQGLEDVREGVLEEQAYHLHCPRQVDLEQVHYGLLLE
jgi:hypothetical protein